MDRNYIMQVPGVMKDIMKRIMKSTTIGEVAKDGHVREGIIVANGCKR